MGLTTKREGQEVIDADEELWEILRETQNAIAGIYEYMRKNGAADLGEMVRAKHLPEKNHRFKAR